MIKYVTEDGKVFTNEQDAKIHEECLPLIKKMEQLLVNYFNARDGHKTIYRPNSVFSITDLATELVETDLAAMAAYLVRMGNVEDVLSCPVSR